MAAVEAEGAVDDAGLGGAAVDVVDGVAVGRGAGAFAVVVDEEDGGVVVEGHALEGAHDHGHVGAVVLVGPAAGAAEGVDDGHAKAFVEDAVDLLEAALAEQAAAGGELAAANAAGPGVNAGADFAADAAGVVADGDVEQRVQPASALGAAGCGGRGPRRAF